MNSLNGLGRIDRAIAVLSPERALRRHHARTALDMTLKFRKFDAAKVDRHTADWFADATDANGSVLYNLDRLRARSRDLYRNNPLAHRACEVIVANTIGTGIVPRFMPRVEEAPETSERLEALWSSWAGSKEIDADGNCNFESLQALALRTIVQSGSVLIRRRDRRPGDRLSLPMQLQVLEPDYLAKERDGVAKNGNTIEGGIERDKLGRRRAYHLYKQHPNASLLKAGFNRDIVPVPAESVLHVFLQRRPGQIDDAPWGASAFLTLRDLKEFFGAMLLRAKIASLFSAFVTHNGQSGENMPLSPVKNPNKPPTSHIEPGAIEYLRPGEQIEFPTVPSGSTLGEYGTAAMRSVAQAYGITYEALTGDLSGVSFISGRMGRLEMHRNLRIWQRQMLIPGLCEPILEWFLDAAFLQGYDVQGHTVSWSSPRQEMLQPSQEVAANERAVKAGFKSRHEVIREMGRDPKEVDAEIAADRARSPSESSQQGESDGGGTERTPDGSRTPVPSAS